jgi:hypothetical protein
VDTVKEEFACLKYFFSLPTHLARPERTFNLCQSKKGELARGNKNFLGVQKGAVTALGVYLQRICSL